MDRIEGQASIMIIWGWGWIVQNKCESGYDDETERETGLLYFIARYHKCKRHEWTYYFFFLHAQTDVISS